MLESTLPISSAAKILWQYSDHIEIFQSHVVVEMWAPPDCFEWGLKVHQSLSSKIKIKWKKLKPLATRRV